MTAVIGANGSGKSTLIRHFPAGLLRPAPEQLRLKYSIERLAAALRARQSAYVPHI